MRIHDDEWRAAQLFARAELADYPKLDGAQRRQVRAWSKELLAEFRAHPALHNLMSLIILLGVIAIDVGLLAFELPRAIDFEALPWLAQGAVILAASLVHAYVVYGYVFFALHEGAAHGTMFTGRGGLASRLKMLGFHACRIYGGDPEHYRTTHLAHHAHFTTPRDQDFTNFVLPRRFFKSLLPFAFTLNNNDFRAHCGTQSTPSRRRSMVITMAFAYSCMGLAYWAAKGFWYPFMVFFMLGPWFSFALDRLDNMLLHNLMPLDRVNGTRDLGLSFWGLLLSGGPWGQPYHWTHHLAPSLPWYQQMALHRRLKAILTPAQREFFMPHSLLDHPRLLLRCLRVGARYARRVREDDFVSTQKLLTTPA